MKQLIPCVVLVCAACASYPTTSPGESDFQTAENYAAWQELRERGSLPAELAKLWYPMVDADFAAYDVLELRPDGTFRRGDFRMFPPAFNPDDSTRIGCEIGAWVAVDDRIHFHYQGTDVGPHTTAYNHIYSQVFALEGDALTLESSTGEPPPMASDPGSKVAISHHPKLTHSLEPQLPR